MTTFAQTEMQKVRYSNCRTVLDHMSDEPEADWLTHFETAYDMRVAGLRNHAADVMFVLATMTDEQHHQLSRDIAEFLAESK